MGISLDQGREGAARDPAGGGADRVPVGQGVRAGGPLERLRHALPELAGTARACGEYVVANPWDVRGLTIRAAAQRTGVSTHAVNRFARRLGYTGYREFLQALALELGRFVGAAFALPTAVGADTGAPDQTPTGIGGIVSQVLALEARGLQHTSRALDLDEATRAVRALAQADGIVVVGAGTGVAVGELAAYRLRLLGLRAVCAGDPAVLFPEVHLCGPSGVVLAVSHQGVTRHTIEVLEHARERELTTICVTAAPASPAARLADIQLITRGEEHAPGVGMFTSRVTAAAVLEALVGGVAWVRRATSLRHVEEVMEVLNRRDTVTYLPKRRSSRKTGTGTGPTADGTAE